MTPVPSAGDCEPDWPTTGRERLRALADDSLRQPNWRDQPAELAALCEQGAADLYGEWATPHDIDTVNPGKYL